MLHAKLCEKFAPKLTNVIVLAHVIRSARTVVELRNCHYHFGPETYDISRFIYRRGSLAPYLFTLALWQHAVNQIPTTRGPALFGCVIPRYRRSKRVSQVPLYERRIRIFLGRYSSLRSPLHPSPPPMKSVYCRLLRRPSFSDC